MFRRMREMGRYEGTLCVVRIASLRGRGDRNGGRPVTDGNGYTRVIKGGDLLQ